MVRRQWSILGLFTVLALVPGGLIAQPQAEEVGTITVVGEGSVEVEPNIATLQIGVESRAEQAYDALAETREAMDSILSVFEKQGIPDADVQTSQFGIHLERMPRGPGGPNAAEFDLMYRVSTMVSVTIRDLPRVANVVDSAVQAGVNQMWGIQFGVSDPEQHEDQAMAKAMANAEERAQYLAGLEGRSLGSLRSVSEVVAGGLPSPASSYRVEGMGAGAPGVRPGRLHFRARLQVVYELAQ